MTSKVIYPFRWDIAKINELGSLIRGWSEEEYFPYSHFQTDLLNCCVKVLAFCDDSDLFFVGRSPESLFDFLRGSLSQTTWADRLNLLHFSMYEVTEKEIKQKNPEAIPALRNYLTFLKLDPLNLARRIRPVALVDVVCSGGTFGNLIKFLQHWCEEERGDWPAIQRKVRIVGIVSGRKPSPNAWRWQQNCDWIEMLPGRNIKNIAVDEIFWDYIAGTQLKVSHSYRPAYWADDQISRATHDHRQLTALKMAVALYNYGKQKDTQAQFARRMSEENAMRYAWYRKLILELSN